jgi:hypothetical protein
MLEANRRNLRVQAVFADKGIMSAEPATEFAAGEKLQPMKGRGLWFWLACGVGGVVLLVGSAGVIPCMMGAQPTARKNECINNLRMIEGAKEQWALENRKEAGALPSAVEIYGTKERPGGYMKYPPECPDGGKYRIGAIGQESMCSLAEKGHRIR